MQNQISSETRERLLEHLTEPGKVLLSVTRDEANAIAETLTLYVEALTDEGFAEDGGEWLLEIRDRILSTPGVH